MSKKVFIEKHPLFYGKVYWFFALVKSGRSIDFELVDYPDQAEITIGIKGDFPISIEFYDRLSIELFDHSVFFDDQLMVMTKEGKEDIISTVFYLVNCIQEFKPNPKDLDKFGRFKPESSVQSKFGITGENYVLQLIDQFLLRCGINEFNKKKSKIYISHDIDFLTSGFRQEVSWALRNGNIKQVFSFTKERLNGGSPWNNIEALASLDQQLAVPSTFYWLNYQQKSKEGISNADYELDVLDLETVAEHGLTNGLHKSASLNTMRKEVGDFPDVVYHNRYHFLKFQLPTAWEEMEKSAIKTDGSLGFSRGIHLRNSYSLPFYPYNIKTERPFKTLILPLQIMDVALLSYKMKDRHRIVEEVMNFVEQHKEDSLISMLWHNNELTPYSNKYMLDAYKDIIDILNESKYEIIGIDQVLKEYG